MLGASMPVSRPVLLLLCLQWCSSAGFLASGYGRATCAAPHCRQPAVVAQYRGRGGGGRGRGGRGRGGRGRGRGPMQQELPPINENIGDFAEVRVLVDVPGESDELVRTRPKEQTNRNRDHSGFPYTDLFLWTLYACM